MGASWQTEVGRRRPRPPRDAADPPLSLEVEAVHDLCDLHGEHLYRTGLLLVPDRRQAADAAVSSMVRLVRDEAPWDRRTSLTTHLTRELLTALSPSGTSPASAPLPVPYECLAMAMVFRMTSREIAAELGVPAVVVVTQIRRDLLALGDG